MFYSHEVLTSRKYGVATIWLVATLGSKSSLKKVNRKQILDVDVPKACETIITPEAPMALRLTSNLLYGVSRVYQQQCGYVLVDAQTMQNNIRTLLKVVRAADLDTEAARARPETLLLPDDPAFMPDLNFANLRLDFELEPMDLITNGNSQASTLLSPHSSQTSFLSGSMGAGGLIIPTSDTGGVGDIGGFVVDSERGSRQGATDLLLGEDHGFLPEPDFTFDADGNMIELDDPTFLGGAVQPPRFSSVPGGGGRALTAPVVHQPFDICGDEYDFIPLGPAAEAEEHEDQPASSVHLSDQHEPSPPIVARQRKKKVPKARSPDQEIELHNADIRDWTENYVDNMIEAMNLKMVKKGNDLAKRNAEHWILGTGLGNVGSGVGSTNVRSPLDIFSGENLYRALTGHDLHPTGQKRTHDETADDGGAERRVRARSEEIARGDGLDYNDDERLGLMDDVEPEVAREVADALDDFSTMPWNVQASVRGSSISRGRAGSIFNSASRPSSFAGPLGSLGGGQLSRRGSRMVSASPLASRAPPLNLGGEEPHSATSGLDNDGFTVAPDFHADNAFEFYGPAAAVDTQTAGESQWQRAVLDTESNNFLGFIENAIEEKIGASVDNADVVKFEELLDPETNSRVVAAQALLHVLSLGTKALLEVRQEEAYGEIEICLVQSFAI